MKARKIGLGITTMPTVELDQAINIFLPFIFLSFEHFMITVRGMTE
jgi:hypothetical protein